MSFLLKQLRDTGLAERKAGSGQPRTALTDENINELVLSQEDAPQSYNIVIYLRHMQVVCTNFLLILTQFSRSHNKKFKVPIFRDTV